VIDKPNASNSKNKRANNDLAPKSFGTRLNAKSNISEIPAHILRSIDGRLFFLLSLLNVLIGVVWILFFSTSGRMPLALFLVPIASFVSLLWIQESFGNGSSRFGVICSCITQCAFASSPWIYLLN